MTGGGNRVKAPGKARTPSAAALRRELDETRHKLAEAEQALEAIRTGQVESIVVEGPDGGTRIFSLEGAAHSYRVLVEEMSEGAATLGEDGTILYCNAYFARMLGLRLERVIGSLAQAHVPVRLRFDFEELLRLSRATNVREEMALEDAAGAEVPALLAVSHLMDAGRDILCLVATDLREQKRTEALARAEQAARESEARYRAIFENTRDLMVLLQPVRDGRGEIVDWHYRDVNAAVLHDLGKRREDLIGHSPRQVLPERATAMEAGWARVLATGEPITYEHPLGDRTYIGRVFRMDEHTVVLTSTDITARKQSEEVLRDADRSKNEFLAMLSHELRNPLAPIKNSLYILGRAAPGGDQARRAQAVIDRQVAQLTRLVDDLLDVTRVSRNKLQLRLERLDLTEVVRRTVEDHRSLFERSGVRLEAHFDPCPLDVVADWARLAQVVGNLLTNAAKFTPRGGATEITVTCDVAERRAVIRVTDNGAGMTPETQARIFAPFVQADRTLASSKGGLGLGLALVKGLVALHHGEVTASSAGLGMGSEFTVWLPLAEAPVVRPPEVSRGRPRSRRRILVIEDNVDSADSLREALVLDDHEVEVAYEGREGLVKARTFRPDLVLCDIGLPDMNGYQVARSLRTEAMFDETFLVALTGFALPDDLERASEAGFDRHLAKPLSLEKLEQLIEQLPPTRHAPGPSTELRPE